MTPPAMTPLALYDRALSWVGIPFVHQGRNRHGCDCAGLVLGVLAEFGRWVEVPVYGPGGAGADLPGTLARLGASPLPPAEAQPGHLLAWTTPAGQPHLGLAGAGEVIHASERQGRVLRQPLRAALAVRLTHAWDLTAVGEGAVRV